MPTLPCTPTQLRSAQLSSALLCSAHVDLQLQSGLEASSCHQTTSLFVRAIGRNSYHREHEAHLLGIAAVRVLDDLLHGAAAALIPRHLDHLALYALHTPAQSADDLPQLIACSP